MKNPNEALRAQAIADYLQHHPEFFSEYADALAQINIPHPRGDKTISLTERQLYTLRDQNRQLEAKLGGLIQFGKDNDAISEKMHRLAVALVSTYTFQAVLHTLGFHLREDFAIPHVALRLWSVPTQKNADLPEFAAVSKELQVFAETLTQPYCGSTAGFETSGWFGAVAPHVRSQALVALRNGGGTIGMLALGSEDSERFFADMGTLYLERLGELVSAALGRSFLSI